MMIRRFALTLLAAFVALPALAALAHKTHQAVPEPAPIPLADTVRVAMVTTLGTIEIELDGKHAPVTAANFLHYVDTKRFDGIAFYRAMHLAWGDQPNGLVQGGLRDPRKLFPPIAHEPTSQTGLSHKAGALSMARNAPGTGSSTLAVVIKRTFDRSNGTSR